MILNRTAAVPSGLGPADSAVRRDDKSASSVTATQRTIDGRRPVMFDYRNLNSDYRRVLRADPDERGADAAWGWIAGAILLLLVLAAAFVSYEPIQPPCRSSCSMSQPG
jgi:hypothetical protein